MAQTHHASILGVPGPGTFDAEICLTHRSQELLRVPGAQDYYRPYPSVSLGYPSERLAPTEQSRTQTWARRLTRR